MLLGHSMGGTDARESMSEIEKPDATNPDGAHFRMPFGWQIATWLASGVVLTAIVLTLLWLSLGWPPVTGPGAPSASEKFDLVKIALAVTGGVGAVMFLVVAYRKQRLGEAADKRDITKESVRIQNYSTSDSLRRPHS
jgi:hypothetical protein